MKQFFCNRNNYGVLTPKKVMNVICVALFFLIISTTSNAQSLVSETVWSLDKFELYEISENQSEVLVPYIDVKEINDCIFHKIELKDENKCNISDFLKNSHNALYSSTDSELIIKHNKNDINYRYSISDSTLTLSRDFNGGNFSGILVNYKIILRFSLQN